jgi:predicted phosphohydrolase
MLKRLPAPDEEMRAAGLNGRFFMSVGNHEVWADPKIEGMLTALPYLRKFGVTPENLIYKFDFKGVRFIYLWSGKYDYRSPSLWNGDRPQYAAQMKQLQQWLAEAKSSDVRKTFITFHYPVFARSGLGPIPAPDNPHKVIASYAKDMEVVVFNGHVHTTEIYEVGGVRYLLLGGGGAEQDPILPGRTSIKVPADYPPDLYWKWQASPGGVQLCPRRCRTRPEDEVHPQSLPAMVGGPIWDRGTFHMNRRRPIAGARFCQQLS